MKTATHLSGLKVLPWFGVRGFALRTLTHSYEK
jgi:hypothetical protein